MTSALVIGAGPAGLMAAEQLAQAGHRVVVCEAKASVGRKFLMAGKSGLNITKAEGLAAFQARFDGDWLTPMLAEFGPDEVQRWCRALGQDVFTGTSGRVFPKAMKASPLLRAWLRRLAGSGVDIRTRWRWTGFQGDGFAFDTASGQQVLTAPVTVLALGGASWARLGSDAAWVPYLQDRDVEIAPFKPANAGLAVRWSPHMARVFGLPVKGAALLAGGECSRGEFVISAKGLEGGGIYAISRQVREGADLVLDLLPGLTADQVEARLSGMRAGETATNRLRKLGLSAPALALVMEFGRGMPLGRAVKRLVIGHSGLRPMDEAISVAGGLTRGSVSETLELRAIRGVFVCGEMLDWEAPTGGYLLTACWATGRWAGRHAAQSIARP
jgi:uncharacterized flavoprotein (TIGR03862 family)